MADTMVVQRLPRRDVWEWVFFHWAAQPFFTVVNIFISYMTTDPTMG